jgi:L-asparaginase
MQIKIFATGGTIDKVYFDKNSDFEVGEPQAAVILKASNVDVDYSVESILKKDSIDFTDEDRAMIRRKVGTEVAARIIITHGTDTMVQTAQLLEDIADKTIVLTGAMLPALFKDSDAVFNMGCATMAAQTLPAGVYIVINGRVFDPKTAKKNLQLKRFETL